MRKALIFALVVCCFVAALAGTAFAQGYRGAGDYYLAPTANPHGGFTTTSRNCGVCHSVHHASSSGEALMRNSIANACEYCHITTNTGYIQIYNFAVEGDSDRYILANDYAHDTSGTVSGTPGSDGVLCTNCHQVHAAESVIASQNAHLVTKILKAPVAPATYQADVEAAGAWPLASGDATGVAVSKWCTRCHPYYNEDYDGTTHTMGEPSAAYSTSRTADGFAAAGVDAQVAWAPSTMCVSCHQRGTTDEVERVGIGVAVAPTYSFPHNSDGKRWLSTDSGALDGLGNLPVNGAQTTDSDGVCINCHRDGSGNGIGMNW